MASLWQRIRLHFPPVTKKHWQNGHSFHALADHYRTLPLEPLLIRARLGSPYAPGVDGRLHLDSLLGAGVLGTIPLAPIPDHAEPCVIPIPAKLLWVCGLGLPLWACSDLVPDGETFAGIEYWHKRYPQGRIEWMDRPSAPTTRGRWKEYRIPVRVEMPANGCLQALMIGHREETQKALDTLSHIGKKPAQGKGRVLKWTVETVAMDETEAIEAILACRAVPLDYYGGVIEGRPVSARSAWTPPYWYKPWHGPVALPCRP